MSLKSLLCQFSLFFLMYSTIHSQVKLADAFPHLTFFKPVDLQSPPDGTNRIFVVTQEGVIYTFLNDSSVQTAKIFLDIQDSVRNGGELGLLGLAFHPQFTSNGYFYVNYTKDNPLRTVISRFSVSDLNPDSADRSSEVILIVQNQPYENHNGGQLAFGPDGYLYIALGDGGSGGDPENNAQSKSTILGKILRINVDSTSDSSNYTIPTDNPFFGNSKGFREEIFAYGFRNPWRFSFDTRTGTLWTCDVGQNSWEEIDIVENGKNYGWRIMEGTHCFIPSTNCDTTGLTLPVIDYFHDTTRGECSVTGGYVYRGSKISSLYGKYIYGDFCTGDIWTIDANTRDTASNTLIINSGFNISSFGVDMFDEVYVCSHDGGKIFRLERQLPEIPILLFPPNGTTHVETLVTIRWQKTLGATFYHLQIASNSELTNFLINDSTIIDTSLQFTIDPLNSTCYWRVRAKNSEGISPFSPTWVFSRDSIFTLSYNLRKYWNIVSVPLRVYDGRKETLFPPAATKAFIYTSKGYQERDTLIHGYGYWIKFNDSTQITISGFARTQDTIDVIQGWNMIGSIITPIAVSSIIQQPQDIIASQFFEYTGRYNPVIQLEPGKGYWVKANKNGKIILSLD